MQKSEVADNQQAKTTEIEKAWLAGIIDGEGSIRIDYPNGRRTNPSPRLVITNTDYEIIDKARDICFKLGISPYIQLRKRSSPNHKDVKDILVLGHTRLLKILPAVLPYLTGRKEKVALLLYRFCESRASKGNINKLPTAERLYSQEEINLVYQIKQINLRGKVLNDYTPNP